MAKDATTTKQRSRRNGTKTTAEVVTPSPPHIRDLGQLLNGPWVPVDQLDATQLEHEVRSWRAWATWLPEQVRYYMSHVGDLCRVVRRDYKSFMGTLQTTTYDLDTLELSVEEKVFDPNTGTYFWEKKIMPFPQGSIASLEFIIDRYELEKEDDAYLAGAQFQVARDNLDKEKE